MSAKLKEELYAIHELACTYFQKQLRDHPNGKLALDELARHRIAPGWATSERDPNQITIDDTLEAFRIGYAPPEPEGEGLAPFLMAHGTSLAVAETADLVCRHPDETGYVDRFQHRLMFAVIDAEGRVVGFSGRALEQPVKPIPDSKEGLNVKYVYSRESPIYIKGNELFGLYQARRSLGPEGVALVEANLDVVSLHAQGLPNVVAPLGGSLTTHQANLLKRFVTGVVFLFDADVAGEKAAKRGDETSRLAGLSSKVARLPPGESPADFARTHGIAALKALVQAAEELEP